MSGTDKAYAAVCRYAMCGTDLAHAAMYRVHRHSGCCGTDLACAATRLTLVARQSVWWLFTYRLLCAVRYQRDVALASAVNLACRRTGGIETLIDQHGNHIQGPSNCTHGEFENGSLNGGLHESNCDAFSDIPLDLCLRLRAGLVLTAWLFAGTGPSYTLFGAEFYCEITCNEP
eukprot:28317-Rhodomonas_salina.5